MSSKSIQAGTPSRSLQQAVGGLRFGGGRQFALTFVAALLFAFFSIFAKYFLTLSNIYDMARVSTLP